ncbi:I78 family peptidase inhibitor [Alteraurantiacibacter palmitatis]|uniref:I78 family peptidase inhibitor n=1 Tax=Alteraurantiacibacter palmitatis TaxID=2054628 RepID=A0ABV7E5W4_9SPHN
MKLILGLAAGSMALAGCATTATDGDMSTHLPAGECDASGVQGLIGQVASAELGTRLLRETGARTLRWGPPRSAMTMDYRPDRLTVSYDDNMLIERISCG